MYIIYVQGVEYMRNYENFSIEDNIQYINEQLNNGISMLTIEKEHYGVGRDTITKKLNRKGYKRSSDGKRQFVLQDIYKCDTKPNKENINKIQGNKDNGLTCNEIKQLRELLNAKDELLSVLKRDNYCNTVNTHYIQNTEDIQIIQTYNTKQRMFRVDVEVLERWNDFCDEYKHIKVQSLISSAINEYIEKYSKR